MRVRQLTEMALHQWRRSNRVRTDGTILPVFTELPRAKGLGTTKRRTPAFPPRREEVTFKAGFFSTLVRIFLWLSGGLYFAFGVAVDRFRGLDTDATRAVRLRLTFEKLGTTFIKFGQQLSMRLDVLPYAYTRELESMLDHVPPIPEAEAIAIVERAIGKPINEVFSQFDSDPIGSASIACVYHAVLKTGEHVAVKVRRPGIGEQLTADMRALEWLLILGELALIPPDFTSNFIRELRMMLIEELDFVREARFGDLYRKATRKQKQFHFVTAPRVFFDLSNAEVLVSEYVQGYWMHEIITALETDDEAAIARLHEMNIDPIVLARRVQLIARFNNFENIFFHADIHPANLLVQPGNKIVLIDFGSCGSFSRKELNSWRRWFDAQSVNDVSGMVQAALAIIEPLPPINKDEFALRLESVFWNDLYAIKSKQSDWSERISARVWIGFLKLSREYNVPMRLNMLRMIRASMLSDTIAARLDHDQDPYKEFRHYEKGAGKRAKKRIIKRLHRLLGPSKYIRIENGIEAGLKSLYQVQRTLDSIRNIRIVPLIGKAAQFFLLSLRTSMWVGGIALAWTMTVFLTEVFRSRNPLAAEPRDIPAIFMETLLDWRFELITLFIVALAGRRIFRRLMDRDKSEN
ncbi:MAG TPA: AarF/UbiB family protein [Thermoanaerobaculia bacterium]|nr:AarF/UbiB family protein [Thermoanaerobaculia bacterium]